MESTYEKEINMSGTSPVWSALGWLFGLLAAAIGAINMLWGNDPEYGLFIFLLSLVFLPPANTFPKAKTGYRIHPILKILLGVFILWSALGVGELPAKVDMMMHDLRSSVLEVDPAYEIELL